MNYELFDASNELGGGKYSGKIRLPVQPVSVEDIKEVMSEMRTHDVAALWQDTSLSNDERIEKFEQLTEHYVAGGYEHNTPYFELNLFERATGFNREILNTLSPDNAEIWRDDRLSAEANSKLEETYGAEIKRQVAGTAYAVIGMESALAMRAEYGDKSFQEMYGDGQEYQENLAELNDRFKTVRIPESRSMIDSAQFDLFTTHALVDRHSYPGEYPTVMETSQFANRMSELYIDDYLTSHEKKQLGRPDRYAPVIAKRLREQHHEPLSLEVIEQRQAFLEAEQQLGVSRAALGMIAAMSLYPELHDKALDTYVSHRETLLLGSSLPEKLQIVDELATMAEEAIPTLHDSPADALGKVIWEKEMLDRALKKFAIVSSILYLKEDERPAQNSNTTVESDQTTPEQSLNYAELSSSLNATIAEFNAQWQVGAKKRKEFGLDELTRSLVNGYQAFGKEPIVGIAKDEAATMASILYRLQEMHSQSVDDKNAMVPDTLELQEMLRDDIAQLQRMAAAENAKAGLDAELIDVTKFIGKLQSNWGAYQQLILNKWPNYQGKAAAEHIGRMLASSFEEIEEVEEIVEQEPVVVETMPEDDTTTPEPELEPEDLEYEDVLSEEYLVPEDEEPYFGKHEDILRNIAEQLDEVILPKGASREDLEMTIKRLNLSTGGHETINWEKLHGLRELNDYFDGKLYRSKEHAFHHNQPWYVSEFEMNGTTYAVVETPVTNSATFVISENLVDAPWIEVVTNFSRDEAAQFDGVVRLHHVSDGPDHSVRVLHAIDKLYKAELA